MAFRDDLEDLEARLAAAHVPLAAVFEMSGVHRITYSRWKKRQRLPRMSTWLDVQDAASRLIARQEREQRRLARRQIEEEPADA